MKKLSIIIVSYNTRKLLIDCLESLDKFLNKSASEVVVVDNASSDGSVEAVREGFDWVQVIANKDNLGFGKANNIGAKSATGEYLLFLNSDTLLVEKIDKIIKFLDGHKEVGALAPRLVLDDGNTEQEAAYGKDPTIRRLLRRNLNKKVEVGEDGFAQVDWVTGAALFIRRELFEEIGGFDEKFFFFFEDADLCRQVRIKGYKIVWYAKTTIIHLGGRSVSSNWKRKQLYYKNQEIYFRKYTGLLGLYLLKLIRCPYKMMQRIKLK